MDPILIINCAADTERRAHFVEASKGTDITFIDAVDARLGASVFKPFVALLGEQFWLDDDIKPGAFACFISHRLAWQYIVDNNIKRAVIAEDDSRLSGAFVNVPKNADLVFVNDRAGMWVPSGEIQDILDPPQDLPRAIGGDGYLLTLNGAEILLKQSAIDRVCCGVDWYLVYACLDTFDLRHRDVKAVHEIKKMWKIMGSRHAILNGHVAQKPLLTNTAGFDSSIQHSEKVKIKLFRQQIKNA